MEVLGYRFSNSKEEDFVKELVSMFNVRFIDQEIAENVIDIRKQYRIKLPDAIIAATANTDDLCLPCCCIRNSQNWCEDPPPLGL